MQLGPIEENKGIRVSIERSSNTCLLFLKAVVECLFLVVAAVLFSFLVERIQEASVGLGAAGMAFGGLGRGREEFVPSVL